jgi:hypothetical protein
MHLFMWILYGLHKEIWTRQMSRINNRERKMILSSCCLKCKYYKTLKPSECSKYCEKCLKPKEILKKKRK